MTRPGRPGATEPLLSGVLGGSPDQPDGAPPEPDCCVVDPEDLPDRAAEENGGNAWVLEDITSSAELNEAEGTVTFSMVSTGGGGATSGSPSDTNDGDTLTGHRREAYVGNTGVHIWRWVSDLGAAYEVASMQVIEPLAVNFWGVGALIERSSDGSSWTPVSQTETTGPQSYTYTFDTPETYRYWRISHTYTVAGFPELMGSLQINEWQIFGEMVSSSQWSSPAPQVVDDDDTTYVEVDGDELVRIDLGGAFRIVRARIRIDTTTSGARTLTLDAWNELDESDRVTLATIPFTATGSAQDVEATWYTTDSYRWFQLDSSVDEVQRIHAVELYEPTLATNHQHDASGVAYDNGASGLTADTIQEAIDELDAAVDALGTPDLDDLGDVVISSPQEDDTLRYVGGQWVNDDRRWEPVTYDYGSGPEPVYDAGEMVMHWRSY